MLQQSAIDQGSPSSLVVTESDLLTDGFEPNPRFHTLLADSDGEPAGLALYFFIYSTWVSRNVLYLEDLYVHARFRGQGIGRALLNHLDRIARESGCEQMRWAVHRDNHRALDLYRSFGAHIADGWLLMSRP
jgi:GNAT superfamily N-acetyltransferase